MAGVGVVVVVWCGIVVVAWGWDAYGGVVLNTFGDPRFGYIRRVCDNVSKMT